MDFDGAPRGFKPRRRAPDVPPTLSSGMYTSGNQKNAIDAGASMFSDSTHPFLISAARTQEMGSSTEISRNALSTTLRSPRTMSRPLSSSRLPSSSLSNAWQPLQLDLMEEKRAENNSECDKNNDSEDDEVSISFDPNHEKVDKLNNIENSRPDKASLAANGAMLFRAASRGMTSEVWTASTVYSEDKNFRPALPARPKNQAAHFLHINSTNNLVATAPPSPKPALPKRSSRVHDYVKRTSQVSVSQHQEDFATRQQQRSVPSLPYFSNDINIKQTNNRNYGDLVVREIVLRLNIRLSSRLSNVIAVIGERRDCIPHSHHESLTKREWKKCKDKSNANVKNVLSNGEEDGETSNFDAVWREIGRTEVIDDVEPGVLTSWLISFNCEIQVSYDEAWNYARVPSNERRIAIYHVPQISQDCHSVDNFVPVGYAIIDLASLLPTDLEEVKNDEDWGIASDHQSHSSKLKPFQHLTIDGESSELHGSNESSSSGRRAKTHRRGTKSSDVSQQRLNQFVEDLSKGIPCVKLPKNKKCVVRISNDGTSIVIDKTYRKKDKPLPLNCVRRVQLVSDMSAEEMNYMSRKRIPRLNTLGETSRTVHFLWKKGKKSQMKHYLVQFQKSDIALKFIHGMLLLLKTRTVKTSASIVVQGVPVRGRRVEKGWGRGSYWISRPMFPRIDTSTLSFQATNRNHGSKQMNLPITIVHEIIEESVFADHVPALFIQAIVLKELDQRIRHVQRRIASITGLRDTTGYESGSVDRRASGVVGSVISVGESVISLGKSAYTGARNTLSGNNALEVNKRGSESARQQLLSTDTSLQDLKKEFTQMMELKDLLLKEKHSLEVATASVPNGSGSFRASSAKKRSARHFMPLNCHSHRVQLGDGTLCAIVTSGAHCAHSLGFKHGGLLPQMEKHKKLSGKSALPPHLFHRLACCVSQSLTAMLTALAFDLANKAQDIRFWKLLQSCGYLCHFECLLSTAGDENGMLDDHIIAIQMLENVTIEVCYVPREDDDDQPRIISMEGSLSSQIIVRMNLGVPLAILGNNIHGNKSGSQEQVSFSIFPVLVTQGINEQQTIANAVGASGRQYEINQLALRKFGR